MNALVSVIIPCYNQGRYLIEAVRSARMAYDGPLEIIIIDDGSTEPRHETYLSEAEKLGSFVSVIRQKNKGLSGARNVGVAAANGRFIQLLDADDILIPGKLNIQVAHLMLNSKLDVSVCNFLLCDESRSYFNKPDEAIAKFSLDLNDFLYKWERGFVIPIHCALFERHVFSEITFNENARAKEDWIFWCRLLSYGFKLSYVGGHWAIYRQHLASMRRSYVAMGKSWLKAALEIDSFLPEKQSNFFESAIDWFESCYRSNDFYQNEILDLQGNVEHVPTLVDSGRKANLPDFEIQELIGGFDQFRSVSGNPLFTVVVPVFNHYEYFKSCLRSLMSQTYRDFEVVCINDASTDPRVSKLFAELGQIKGAFHFIENVRNYGISFTQNLAAANAQGRYLVFLDCDDLLECNALSEVARVLSKNHNIDYLFTDRFDIDETGAVLRVARYGGYSQIQQKEVFVKEDLIDGMVASHLKVIRKDSYLSVGGTSDEYSGCQDWELALKLVNNFKFFYLSVPLYRHRIHPNSVTVSQNVGQFQKTNELRRLYIHGILDERPVEHNYINEKNTINQLDNAEVIYVAGNGLPSLIQLKNDLRHTKKITLDLRGGQNMLTINFAREFNSYFDSILWDDPVVPGSLLGYLWSDEVLIHAPL